MVADSVMPFSAISAGIMLLLAAFSAVFILYATSYILYLGNQKRYQWLRSSFGYFFAALVIIFVLQLALISLALKGSVLSAFFEPGGLFLLLPVTLPPILLLMFSREIGIAKFPKRYLRNVAMLRAILIATAIILILILYLTPLFNWHTAPDDEELAGIYAAQALLSGQNPYFLNFEPEMYNYLIHSRYQIGITITSNNTFESRISYPALYFLTSLPFAALPDHLVNFPYAGLNLNIALFTILLMLVVVYTIKPEFLKRPPVVPIIFLALFFVIYASFIDILMLALILAGFYFIDSKYLWIILGISASVQEQLWIPVVLMLVYSFRMHGIRRCALNIIGAFAIFLVINGYFIAGSPTDFIRNVVSPTSGAILPSPSPFGYPILYLYHTMLSMSTILFMLATIFIILLYAYLNEKRLIFLFSLIPLMFLYRSSPTYFQFFLVAMVLSFYIGRPAGTGAKAPNVQFTARQRSIVAILCAAVAAIAIIMVYQSNLQYSHIGVSVVGGRLSRIGNITLYNFTVIHNDTTPNALSVMGYSQFYGKGAPAPLINGSIILKNPTPAMQSSNVGEDINPNYIALNGRGSTNVSVIISTNASDEVVSARCVLYKGAFYYPCPVTYAVG